MSVTNPGLISELEDSDGVEAAMAHALSTPSTKGSKDSESSRVKEPQPAVQSIRANLAALQREKVEEQEKCSKTNVDEGANESLNSSLKHKEATSPKEEQSPKANAGTGSKRLSVSFNFVDARRASTNSNMRRRTSNLSAKDFSSEPSSSTRRGSSLKLVPELRRAMTDSLVSPNEESSPGGKMRSSLTSQLDQVKSPSGFFSSSSFRGTGKGGSNRISEDDAEDLGIAHSESRRETNSRNVEAGGRGRFSSRGSRIDDFGDDEDPFHTAFNRLGLRDTQYEQKFREITGYSVWDDLFAADGLNGLSAGVHLSCVHSKVVRWLDCFRLFTVLWAASFAPLCLAIPEAVADSWHTLDGVVDAFCALLMALQLQTSFIAQNGVEVYTARHVFRERFTSATYLLQALSCTLAPVLSNAMGLTVWGLFLKIFRGCGLFGLPDSLWYLKHSLAYQISKLILLIIVTSHVVACVWMTLGGYREALLREPERFVGFGFVVPAGKGQAFQCPDMVVVYLMGLVEAVLMMTGIGIDDPLGSMEVSPRHKNAGGLVMLACLSTMGCLLASYIFSNFVIAVQQRSLLQTKHQEKLKFMREAMTALNIPDDLQHRVVMYQHFQKLNHPANAIQALFDERNVTAVLETELRIFLYHKVILNSPFFAEADPQFSVEVILALDDESYLPGDFVIRRGDMGHEMYHMLQGEVAVIGEEHMFLGIFHPGDYFGEAALLRGHLRLSWVRANTYSVFAILHRSKLEQIWEHYPEQRKILPEKIMEALARREDKQLKDFQSEEERELLLKNEFMSSCKCKTLGKVPSKRMQNAKIDGKEDAMAKAPRRRSISFAKADSQDSKESPESPKSPTESRQESGHSGNDVFKVFSNEDLGFGDKRSLKAAITHKRQSVSITGAAHRMKRQLEQGFAKVLSNGSQDSARTSNGSKSEEPGVAKVGCNGNNGRAATQVTPSPEPQSPVGIGKIPSRVTSADSLASEEFDIFGKVASNGSEAGPGNIGKLLGAFEANFASSKSVPADAVVNTRRSLTGAGAVDPTPRHRVSAVGVAKRGSLQGGTSSGEVRASFRRSSRELRPRLSAGFVAPANLVPAVPTSITAANEAHVVSGKQIMDEVKAISQTHADDDFKRVEWRGKLESEVKTLSSEIAAIKDLLFNVAAQRTTNGVGGDSPVNRPGTR